VYTKEGQIFENSNGTWSITSNEGEVFSLLNSQEL